MLKKIASVAILTIFSLNIASAQNLGDLGKILNGGSGNGSGSVLGNVLGGDTGSILGNLLEGVFSSSNITVEDMQGTWKSTGPAVCFQSDNFLQKAGGLAAAAAIETKIKPYYEKYGLNNAVMTIDANGNFTLTASKITLKGNIKQKNGADKGVFDFNFTVLGKIQLGSVTTYVQKTSNSMDVMFDATKLKSILSKLTQYLSIDILKSMGSILDSYEGLCVGFKMSYTGAASGVTTTTTTNNGLGGLGKLGEILKGGSTTTTNSNSGTSTNTGTSTTTTTTRTDNSSTGNSNGNTSGTTTSSALDKLKEAMGKTKK